MVFARMAMRQRKAAARRLGWHKRGVQVPPLLIVSVTRGCNLRCAGCFVHAQGLLRPAGGEGPGEIAADEFRALFAEAAELGVSMVVLAGGEPLVRPELLDVAGEFPQLTFIVVTNGSLFDASTLDTFTRHRHIIPMLSLDGAQSTTDERRGCGAFVRVTAAMEALRSRRLFFGASIMVTRTNFAQVTSRVFVRDLVSRGCRLFFYADYVPVEAGTERLVPSQAQRSVEKLTMLLMRREFPALFVASSAGEQAHGGCLAAGRGFVHLNPEGGIEPCPFSPYSDVDVRGGGLKRALESPFLRTIRESGRHLGESEGGCALWNQRAWLEGLLASSTAVPGADEREDVGQRAA